MKKARKRRFTPPLRMPSDYNKSRITPLWIAGCYYNPNDPHLFVPSLRGLNPTINLGHPLGWRMMGVMVVAWEGMILVISFLMQSFFLLFGGVCFLIVNLLVLGYVYRRISGKS